ncbi:hypothetical protein NLG97_g3795 [Lecanicillium saksenae]|uniref:Uncharacterized protein n=1 Tax=Lecanicillium saksenae TaxID=468837 RepID=A0ACC1QXN3_9HYPO|nr:hypothetical protein NLG97_g3795 [Lecanicillium saksenae]
MAVFEQLVADPAQAGSQSQSLLYKLPLEVRTAVYQFVYPEHILHFRRNFMAKDHNKPYCHANWCVTTGENQLGRHTMHFPDEEVLLEWFRLTPKVHTDAITSVRLTGLCVVWPLPEDFKSAWTTLASLPNLRHIGARITGCELDEAWTLDEQTAMAEPMKEIQQSSLQSFDIIFNIGDTWFPDDYYIRISYNLLNWDMFSFDQAGFPSLFDGMHPRCRIIGMNGFIFNRPVRDDMPTREQLCNWMSWFCAHAAYGAIYPPGYDSDEVGGKYAAAAAAAENDEIDETAVLEKARDERERLQTEYLPDSVGEQAVDPVAWDLAAINRVVDVLDSTPNRWPRAGRWTFPEKPSWIENGTLAKPHEFPPMEYGGGSDEDEFSD